jgi:hypothetical protein
MINENHRIGDKGIAANAEIYTCLSLSDNNEVIRLIIFKSNKCFPYQTNKQFLMTHQSGYKRYKHIERLK